MLEPPNTWRREAPGLGWDYAEGKELSMKAVIIACLGLLIFSETKADYKAPDKQEIEKKFCRTIKGQTTMLMNTYNSNEEEIDRGNQEVRNEGVRIRSISLTNLNFMANIWVAFCKK